jgi:hypothetical protein
LSIEKYAESSDEFERARASGRDGEGEEGRVVFTQPLDCHMHNRS